MFGLRLAKNFDEMNSLMRKMKKHLKGYMKLVSIYNRVRLPFSSNKPSSTLYL